MKGTDFAAAAALLLVALSLVTARAAGAVKMGLSYEADPSCPDGHAFAGLVGQRAPSVELALVAAGGADIAVALREADGSFRGTLQIRRADGHDYVREMSGSTCGELGSALAFVAALALSRQENEGAPAREESPAIDTPPRPDEPEAPPSPATTTPSPGWFWSATVGLGIRFGIAPTWANTEALDLETGPPSDSLVAPVVRLGVVHAEPVTYIDRFGSTKFTWTTVRAAGCPIRVHLIDRIEVRPCVGVGWGFIGASGVPSTPRGTGQEGSSGWADAFGALRLRLQIWGPLYGVAEAELTAALTRYQFAFDPGAPVYDVPLVAGAGFAGLSGQIP